MGKIICTSCKKSCKGQAIRLQDHYFHVKCFKCNECKKLLATSGFYTHDGTYYCQEDYQRLFGTKCSVCDKYVEGEVVTALGKTYHIDCFHCTRCNQKFCAGDKVTYTGKDYLCSVCLDQTQSEVTTPATDGEMGSPTKKVKAPFKHSTPFAQDGMIDTQLSSPVSDMSDISTDKENLQNGMTVRDRDLMSPLSTTSGYKSDASSDRGTHDRSSEVFDDFLGVSDKESKKTKGLRDQSVPGAGSDTEQGGEEQIEIFEAVPADDQDDSDHKERLSPIQNIMSYRSPSPAASSVSKATRDSTTSSGSRFEVNYGKFYNTSYLEKTTTSYKKGPSLNVSHKPRSPHFHRPENFSYTQVRKDFIRPIKKGIQNPETHLSMLNKLGDTKLVLKKKEHIPVMDNKEPIQLAKFPDAQKPDEGRPPAIEREDWPAPPAPAAAFPELLREKKKGRSGRRSTTTSGAETTDTELETEISEWEDEPDARPIDPKIQREIDYLLKHGGTGAARAFLRELERKGAESPTLDPISASRTPAADREPHYKLRYTNPVFASPSRDTEFRPRLYSLDDQLIGRKYRSTTQTVGNFPVDFHGYEIPKRVVHRLRVPRPGYGLAPPSSAHSTADSREAGYFSDTGFVRHTLRHERMFDRDGDTTDGEMTDKETLERRSFYSSQSSIEEYDPTTGLRRSKLRSSTVSSEGLSTPFMGYKRIGTSLLKPEAPPQIYPYEQLKITNPSRPPDTDINTLERHLSKEEFESLFHMTREEFYRLAEWKRNDMKRRVQLF